MDWVTNFPELRDFLALVVLYAPDEFPKEDYLRDDEQLTLESAFEEIYRGQVFVAKKIKDQNVLDCLRQYLDESLAAYRGGDDMKGAHLLQDYERMLSANVHQAERALLIRVQRQNRI